jgi:protein TonB
VTALFEDAWLDRSFTRRQPRALKWTVSLAVHGILVAAMFVVPLYWIDRIDLHPANYTQLVASSARLGAGGQVSPAPRRVAAATKSLMAPRTIPIQVETSRRQPSDTDVVAETAPEIGETLAAAGQGSGPYGGLDGGTLLAGISVAHLPPAVLEPRPNTPLTIGGKVKAPRLVSKVDPIYPPLLRRAKVQGDVVVDTVIDTGGNVVDEQIVSGTEFLAAAAMDALRQWKYEPTLLNGQAFPVHMRVTIAFRLDRKS